MKIEILGTGCAKCSRLAETVEAAAKALGVEYQIEKVTRIADIASYGVMVTPALVVDGQVKLAGKVPPQEEIQGILKAAAK